MAQRILEAWQRKVDAMAAAENDPSFSLLTDDEMSAADPSGLGRAADRLIAAHYAEYRTVANIDAAALAARLAEAEGQPLEKARTVIRKVLLVWQRKLSGPRVAFDVPQACAGTQTMLQDEEVPAAAPHPLQIMSQPLALPLAPDGAPIVSSLVTSKGHPACETPNTPVPSMGPCSRPQTPQNLPNSASRHKSSTSTILINSTRSKPLRSQARPGYQRPQGSTLMHG